MTVVKRQIMAGKRILLFSERNIYEQEVWRGAFAEFENILENIDSVQLLAPKPKKIYSYKRRISMGLGKHSRLYINPGLKEIKINQYFDIFLTICEKPSELLNVNVVKGWKDFCKTSICWLTEFYIKDMKEFKSCLEILSKFDYVIFMFVNNEPFKKIIKGKSFYLPAGIDSIKFCPYPGMPNRVIDFLSIGRRSDTTHKKLLKMAEENKIFYIYDTIDDLHTYNIEQHRLMIANMAKRSRYFLVNPGKIDRPEETGGQSEFGYRYFEGAAPGAIMIGEIPKNNEFDKIFHWDDAVIHLPFGSDKIEEIIIELDGMPERQERIRKTNIIQSLLHHDWVYRWETILSVLGFEPLPELIKRKERLRVIAEKIE